MKRAIGLAIIIIICIISCLSVQGTLPFMPVFGSGMEPSIPSGSLIIARPLKAADIVAGDIVISKVPPSARQDYGYPPVSAFRVTEVVKDQSGLSFRLRDDNSAGESFLVRQYKIKGEIGGRIPVLGYPLMIFKSTGMASLVFFFILMFALYLYSREISSILGKRFRDFVSPVIEENHRADEILSKRMEATEKALESFAGAMQEYAQHLASHTFAIKGLAEASQELKNSAAEQNHILSHLTSKFVPKKTVKEVSRIEGIVYEFKHRTREILRAKEALEKETRVQTEKDPEETIVVIKIPSPQGCVVKPKALLEKRHFYSVGSKVTE